MSAMVAYQFRESLNQGLAEKVAALDRNHYPDSLIEILEAALLDLSSPRGLPLLAAAVGESGADAGDGFQAAEVLWQGLLLTGLMAVGKKPGDGLAAGLAYRFDSAHLLLAADTMLTWPFEFFAQDGETKWQPSTLASGSHAALTALVAVGNKFASLLDWNPLGAFLAAGCPGRDLEAVDGLAELLRAAYIADLARWLGSPSWIAGAADRAYSALRGLELAPRLEEIRDMLLY